MIRTAAAGRQRFGAHVDGALRRSDVVPVTPFQNVPKERFRKLMAAPMAGAFVVGILLMGALADPSTFRPQPVENAAGIYSELPTSVRELHRGGFNHWRTILFFGTHVPEVCWGDNAVNDFQRRQCGEFWERLALGGALGLLPFGAAWLAWVLALGSLQRVYRHAHKRINEGKPLGGGIVTDPAEAEGDWFSRLYCLRPIAVQVAGDRQIKVYIPLDVAPPSPGTKMVLYQPLAVLGELRHFGTYYAPHVVVFAGVRQG
jgi:hypothetical protein